MSDLDKMIAVLNAANTGAVIEARSKGVEMPWLEFPTDLMEWNFLDWEYRVKPKSVIRHIRADELPKILFWVREDRCTWLVIGVNETDDEIYFNGHWRSLRDLKGQYSIDRKNWKPFTVEE